MKTVVRELAALVDGRVIGDPEVEITGFAGVDRAGPGHVTFVALEKWAPLLKTTRASAVVVQAATPDCPAVQIVVADANLAFAKLVARLQRDRARGSGGVDPRAVIEAGAAVDTTATVRAGAVIARGARVGPRTVIGSGAYVGEDAVLGADCLLHPNATVLHDVRIGDRVIIHSGAVVGSDGFGYATDARGEHHKIPQVGSVVVEDDVEIGANTTVDRARFDETRIGRGTKIDNLVQIAHNVRVGPHCILVAHSGVAGSSTLGAHVVLGAMVGVTGHVSVGDGAQISAMSGVSKDTEGGQAYMGVPIRPIREGMKIRALQLRLPEIYGELKDARARLDRLEARLGGGGA